MGRGRAKDRGPFLSSRAGRSPSCATGGRDRGKYNTVRNYQSALNSLSRYLEGKDLALSEVTDALVEAYGAWLTGSGVCPNTLSFYMRTLRASYNKAVERGLVAQAHPFRNVYTGIDKTHPRAITERPVPVLLRDAGHVVRRRGVPPESGYPWRLHHL